MMEIKNIKTGKVKSVTKDDFEKIKKNENTAFLWHEIASAKTPPEVKELEDKKNSRKQQTQNTASSIEKADEGK